MPGVPAVGDLKLNSYYVELGEISFMKEVLAYQVRASKHLFSEGHSGSTSSSDKQLLCGAGGVQLHEGGACVSGGCIESCEAA
jgi:hypothetical protein